MIAIRINELPSEFQGSAYYQNLLTGTKDERDAILVPEECTRTDMSIMCEYDLEHMLRTAMFWGFESATPDMLAYCFQIKFPEPHNKNEKKRIVLECANNVPDTHKSPIYQELLAVANPSDTKQVIRAGLSVLPFLKVNCGRFNAQHYVKEAIEQNKVDCLRYLLAGSNKTTTASNMTYTKQAVTHGHLDCLIYLHENGYGWNDSAVDTAIAGDHLECFVYLITHKCPIKYNFLIRDAVRHNSIASLDYILANAGLYLESHCFEYCTSIEAVYSLVNRNCPWNKDTLWRLLQQWSRTNNIETEANNIETEANNIAHLIKYCHSHGCPLHSEAIDAAIRYELYDCLVYLVENDCPWKGRVGGCDFTPIRAKCYAYLAQANKFAH